MHMMHICNMHADVVDVDEDKDDDLRLATCSADPINKLVPSFPKFALVPSANMIVKKMWKMA